MEAYVHRSGRTGRAGEKGACITLYKHNQKSLLDQIARETGTTIRRIGAPQPSDIVKATAIGAVEELRDVHDDALDLFDDAATKAVEEFGMCRYCVTAVQFILPHISQVP